MPLQAIHTDLEVNKLRQLQSGDSKAFDYFYALYSLPIYRKLLKMVKVDLIAEEILQNLFIKLWDKRKLIDPERPLKAYLNQMAQNMVMDFYRNLAREQKLQSELKLHLSEITEITEESVIFKETNELLEEAVSLLPDQQRVVFRLCKLEGKSYDEVSELLGISTSTINSHIVKATRKVKAHLFNSHKVVYFINTLAVFSLIKNVLNNIF